VKESGEGPGDGLIGRSSNMIKERLEIDTDECRGEKKIDQRCRK
jgi:hypothetical protein